MPFRQNKLYVVLGAACTAGYVWLYLNLSMPKALSHPHVEVCLMKHLTDVPCPSCGSTRSVLAMLNGNISEALYWNPLGIILLLGLLVIPPWIGLDAWTRRRSLPAFYEKMEVLLQKKTVATPLVVLIFINWIWNILKHV